MRLPSQPKLWLAGFFLWLIILCILSSGPIPVKTGFEIPYFDKFVHFGYFFGGSGLLHAALFLGTKLTDRTRYILVVGILASVGILDEWHQSWVPERSGNDPWDWLADLLGAAAGGLVFFRCRRWFRT
jgi:VanZ family protein